MPTPAQVRDGWLEVACDAHDRSIVHIAVTPVGVTGPAEWVDAYRGWDDTGQRVAKIRPPTRGSCMVWLRVDGNAVRLARPVTL